MLQAQPSRLRRFDAEGCNGSPQGPISCALACHSYVDLGVSVSTTAQGTVGGGNIFNAAPLFGNQTDYKGGSSTGNDGASASATTAQSPFGGASAVSPTSPLASLSTLSNYLPYILLTAGGLALILIFKAAKRA